jgi:hypothetical protein
MNIYYSFVMKTPIMTKARNIPQKYGVEPPSPETKNRRRHVTGRTHTTSKHGKNKVSSIIMDSIVYTLDTEVNEVQMFTDEQINEYLDEKYHGNY